MDTDVIDQTPSPTDVPPFTIRSLQPLQHLAKDRQVVVSHLSLLISDDPSEDLSELPSLAEAAVVIMSHPEVDWQDLVIGSCFSKGLHKWMAERSWLLPELGARGFVGSSGLPLAIGL